jgi:hypothetical protein
VRVRSDKKAEIVLSDGSFASIYHLKLGHLVLTEDSSDMLRAAKLITLTVKIDDKYIGIEEALNLNVSDFNLIIKHLTK